MEVSYELEPKDLIAYNKYFASKQKTHKPMVAMYSFIFGTFLLADFVYAILSGSADIWNFKSFLTHLIIRFLVLALLVGVVLTVLYVIQLRLGKFVAKIEKNGVLCPHKIVINEKELIEMTNVNSSRHSWSSVANIEEIEKFILITVSSSATFIIPKRHFQDREHIEKFLETANCYHQNANNTFQLSYLTEYEKSLQ